MEGGPINIHPTTERGQSRANKVWIVLVWPSLRFYSSLKVNGVYFSLIWKSMGLNRSWLRSLYNMISINMVSFLNRSQNEYTHQSMEYSALMGLRLSEIFHTERYDELILSLYTNILSLQMEKLSTRTSPFFHHFVTGSIHTPSWTRALSFIRSI